MQLLANDQEIELLKKLADNVEGLQDFIRQMQWPPPVAYLEAINAARDWYVDSEDVRVDDDSKVALGDECVWVQAWLRVPTDEEVEEADAKEVTKAKDIPTKDKKDGTGRLQDCLETDPTAVFECPGCGGNLFAVEVDVALPVIVQVFRDGSMAFVQHDTLNGEPNIRAQDIDDALGNGLVDTVYCDSCSCAIEDADVLEDRLLWKEDEHEAWAQDEMEQMEEHLGAAIDPSACR